MLPSQQPSLLILVPTFAVGFSSWTPPSQGWWMFSRSSAFYLAVFMFPVLVPKLLRLRGGTPFHTSWWAVSFPLAAISNAALKSCHSPAILAGTSIALAVLAFATAIIPVDERADPRGYSPRRAAHVDALTPPVLYDWPLYLRPRDRPPPWLESHSKAPSPPRRPACPQGARRRGQSVHSCRASGTTRRRCDSDSSPRRRHPPLHPGVAKVAGEPVRAAPGPEGDRTSSSPAAKTFAARQAIAGGRLPPSHDGGVVRRAHRER